MTIKQFAKKYDVPYRKAFNASYGLKPEVSEDGKNEYNEQDLRDNLLHDIYRRKVRAELIVKECHELTKKVNRIECDL